MTSMRLCFLLLLAVLPACAPGPGSLPFHAAPAMEAVRRDAETLARALESGSLRRHARSAERLSVLRLADGYDEDTPPRFLELEDEFRRQAGVLARHLNDGDVAASTRAFDVLLDRCDACHATFRPGGVRGR